MGNTFVVCGVIVSECQIEIHILKFMKWELVRTIQGRIPKNMEKRIKSMFTINIHLQAKLWSCGVSWQSWWLIQHVERFRMSFTSGLKLCPNFWSALEEGWRSIRHRTAEETSSMSSCSFLFMRPFLLYVAPGYVWIFCMVLHQGVSFCRYSWVFLCFFVYRQLDNYLIMGEADLFKREIVKHVKPNKGGEKKPDVLLRSLCFIWWKLCYLVLLQLSACFLFKRNLMWKLLQYLNKEEICCLLVLCFSCAVWQMRCKTKNSSSSRCWDKRWSA